MVRDEGREYWVFEGDRQLTMGLNAVVGKPREQWGMEPARFTDMIPGCYDPHERVKDLRSNCIYASVNFPTLPGFGGRKFVTVHEKELALTLPAGVERLRARRVVRGGAGGLRADGHHRAVGRPARRHGVAALSRQGRQGR